MDFDSCQLARDSNRHIGIHLLINSGGLKGISERRPSNGSPPRLYEFQYGTGKDARMVRIVAQAILSAAGVIVAFFVSENDIGYPIYQMIVSLLLIVVAALLVWYVPRLIRRNNT
jgi:hypothetical protein